MIKPSASIRIAAAPATVIGFIADPTNGPRWTKALEVAELITPGPIARGSRFREVMSAGGKRVEAPEVPEQIRMQAGRPPKVHGVVDVAEPIELVLAHRPAHAVARVRLAFVGHH